MKKKMRMLGLILFTGSMMLVSCEKDYMEDDDTSEVILSYSSGDMSNMIDFEEADEVRVK